MEKILTGALFLLCGVLVFFILSDNNPKTCDDDINFLSNDKIIDIALNYFIDDKDRQKKSMQRTIYVETRDYLSSIDYGGSSSHFGINNAGIETVPYLSVSEFLAENPDCCSVSPLYDEHSCDAKFNPKPVKMKGSYHNCVIMRYRIKYKDQLGNLKTRAHYSHSSVMVSSCGKPGKIFW